jgi:hypothetical protein
LRVPGGSGLTTPILSRKILSPPALMAVILYDWEEDGREGVPEIVQLVDLKLSPEGSAGSTEQEVMDPPLFFATIGWIN